jgi:hypothetical protein
MDALVEILKIILPAAAVFLAVYFLVQRFFDNEQKRREHELKRSTLNIVTPQKIQAYERIVIFLERINPNNLVIRVNKHGISSRQLHLDLVTAVKSEYEHNISQQVFVSYGAWELVKTAKEEIIKLINISATKVPQDAPSNELAMMILNIAANVDKKMPNEIALEYVKKEIAQIF